MFRKLNPKWLLVVLTSFTMAVGCKPAGFEMLSKKKQKDEPTQAAPAPQPAPAPSAAPTADPMKPSARVEVIARNVSVTWIPTGTAVIIRPTNDTLDPDDVGKNNCPNPGIVKVDFDLAEADAKPSVTREDGQCNALATSYTFKNAGTYLIRMTVTSNEGETASASMTLQVVSSSVISSQSNSTQRKFDGGFAISALPLIGKVGQNIAFTGVCELLGDKTIHWNIPGTTDVTGTTASSAFPNPGVHVVSAECKSSTGKSATSSLTLVILSSDLPGIPGGPVISINDNPWIVGGGTNTQCNPAQAPCTPNQGPVPPPYSGVPY